MSTALEKLTYTILLVDKLSQPAQNICKSMQKIQKESQAAFSSVMKGFSGLLASSTIFSSFTAPAREFEKSLNEVASLGTSADDLDALSKASKSFAMQFGADAASVARSAYDIQSAIPGLAKGALAAFTYQGNMLAKATKADAATITKFQGTMYNIFEKPAGGMIKFYAENILPIRGSKSRLSGFPMHMLQENLLERLQGTSSKGLWKE